MNTESGDLWKLWLQWERFTQLCITKPHAVRSCGATPAKGSSSQDQDQAWTHTQRPLREHLPCSLTISSASLPNPSSDKGNTRKGASQLNYSSVIVAPASEQPGCFPTEPQADGSCDISTRTVVLCDAPEPFALPEQRFPMLVPLDPTAFLQGEEQN